MVRTRRKGRFFDDLTLKEIGDSLGLTREAIRQRERRALDSLRSRLHVTPHAAP